MEKSRLAPVCGSLSVKPTIGAAPVLKGALYGCEVVSIITNGDSTYMLLSCTPFPSGVVLLCQYCVMYALSCLKLATTDTRQFHLHKLTNLSIEVLNQLIESPSIQSWQDDLQAVFHNLKFLATTPLTDPALVPVAEG
jgi:hypothetical protein